MNLDDRPPEPPPLPLDNVHALIDWVDATAAWLREDAARARRAGHPDHPGASDVLRIYEGVGVLLREAYETRMDEL